MTKKKIIFLIFITMLFFTGSSKVFAEKCTHVDCKDVIDKVREKKETESLKMVCSYVINSDGLYANLIFYDINEKKFYSYSSIAKKGIFGELNSSSPRFIDSDAMDNLRNFSRCPRYSYADFDGNKEVCYDSNGEGCKNIEAQETNNHETKSRKLNFTSYKNSRLIDDKVNEYKNYDNTFTGSCDKDNELAQQYGGFCRYLDSSGADYILVYYNDTSSTIVMYSAEKNEYSTIKSGEIGKFPSQEKKCGKNYYNKINGLNSCPNELYYATVPSETEKEQVMGAAWVPCNNFYIYGNKDEADKSGYNINTNFKLNQCIDDDNVITKPDKTGCELIPTKIMGYINEVMSIIRIAIPALLVGLIIFDFASALFASSEEKMKKAQGKVIKRIIIAIIIFFVPALINLVLNIVNDVWSNANYEICGLDK